MTKSRFLKRVCAVGGGGGPHAHSALWALLYAPSCSSPPVTLAAVSSVHTLNFQVSVCRWLWGRSLKGRQRVCPGSALQLSARPGGWWGPWPRVLSRQRPLRLSTSPAHKQAGTPTRPRGGHRGSAQEHWPVIEHLAWLLQPRCLHSDSSSEPKTCACPPGAARRGYGFPWSTVLPLYLGARGHE